ncbi:MAG: MarC family protein [Rhizobiaceae bacterium]|jgi:multiple antibiotic resistance protein|nr:MarC family protein [Rhizobiaceae bacterium]
MAPEQLLNAFATLIVLIDPPGVAAIFLAVTAGFSAAQRRSVAIRASLIAGIILIVFSIAGAGLLRVFGITLDAFRIAGGIMLFWIAFEMVFEKRQPRREKQVEVAVHEDHVRDISVFPLAIPLIAGPGSISAIVLLSGTFNEVHERAALSGIIIACIGITLLSLLAAERLNAVIANSTRSLITRLLGLILAALAVQFVADGIKSLAA